MNDRQTAIDSWLRKDYFAKNKWDLINSTPLGRRLTLKQIDALNFLMDVYEIPANVTIFEEKSPEAYMAVIAKGSMEIWHTGHDGEKRVLAVVPAGSTFGELSVIDGGPRSASATTVEPCTILLMTREKFQDMINRDPGLAAPFLLYISELMTQRLRRTTIQLLEFLEGE